MKPELAIVIVSDIHSSKDNLYECLRPRGAPTPPISGKHLSCDETILALRKAVDTVSPDRRLLIVGGDLSSANHSEEIEAACEFVTKIADELGVPSSHRALLPGNHDIDWNLTKLAESDVWYDSIRTNKFASIVGKAAPTFRFPINGKSVVLSSTTVPVEIVLVDSAFNDRHNKSPHAGRVGDSQLSEIDRLLTGGNPESLRIMALHHHITAFGRAVGHPDYSLVEDARELLELAAGHGVRMVVHGHQHRAQFDELTMRGQQILVVGAGSLTSPSVPPACLNSFQAVIFDKIDPKLVCGKVISRVFRLTSGWDSPAFTYDALAAETPFGPAIADANRNGLVEQAIQLADREPFVKLLRFLEDDPSGQHMSVHDFKKLIERELKRRGTLDRYEFLHDRTTDSYQFQQRLP